MNVGCLFYVSLSGKFWEKLENRENPPTGSDMYPEFWTHIYELG